MEDKKIMVDFRKTFSKAWVKFGSEFDGGDAILWSGEETETYTEGSFEMPLFDYYAENSSYVFGVHKDAVAFADKHNCYWEAYDAATYLMYRS